MINMMSQNAIQGIQNMPINEMDLDDDGKRLELREIEEEDPNERTRKSSIMHHSGPNADGTDFGAAEHKQNKEIRNLNGRINIGKNLKSVQSPPNKLKLGD